jgi:histidine triad (HIT) family protein
MTADPECIFCRIVSQQIPASLVYQDDDVTAFNDLNPQAPTHVLLVPNQHIANTEALEPAHDAIVGAVIRTARTVARSAGIADSGYRLVINTGRDANNTVAHLHAHLLGGRAMSWPPG